MIASRVRLASAAAVAGLAWLSPPGVGVAGAETLGSDSDAGAASAGSAPRAGHHRGARSSVGASSGLDSAPVSGVRAPSRASVPVTVQVPPAAAVPRTESAILEAPKSEARRVDAELPALSSVASSGAEVVINQRRERITLAVPTVADFQKAPAAPAAVASPIALPAGSVDTQEVSPVSAAAAVALPAASASAPVQAVARQPVRVLQRIGAVLYKLVDHATYRVSQWPAGPAKDLLAGALLLTKRALSSAGLGGGGAGPGSGEGGGGSSGFGEGNVQLTIRNESEENFEIWYAPQHDSSTWEYKTTLAIGESFTSTRTGDLVGGHSYLIKVDGVWKLHVDAENLFFRAPQVGFEFCCQTPRLNYHLGAYPDRGQSNTLSYPDQGFAEWVWRGPDLDSGSAWKANTKVYVVSLWEFPTKELDWAGA